MYPYEDASYESYTIKDVQTTDTPHFYDITMDNGWSTGVVTDAMVPEAGDILDLWYVNGPFTAIRGRAINGEVIEYQTKEDFLEQMQRQQQEKNEKQQREYTDSKKELDSRIQKLPVEFQQRIHGFRERNENFGWKYETYELFCCEEALKIANHFNDPDKIRWWYRLPYQQQQAEFTGLSDEHSGNTFGASVTLAVLFLEEPELLPKMHGALCPLVGCEDYGCFAAQKEGTP